MIHVHDLNINPKGEWLIKSEGIFHGPFDRDQIKELLSNGETSADTEFYPTMRRYFKLSDHKAVFHFFPEIGDVKSTHDMTKTLFLTQNYTLSTPWYKHPMFFFGCGSLLSICLFSIKFLIVRPK